MSFVITTVEKKGNDLLFNNRFLVPRSKVTIAKRDGFCTCIFDQIFYTDEAGTTSHHLDIFPAHVTMPAGVSDNDDLFMKLAILK